MTAQICIPGGSGFVGRHLASELARQGYNVRIPTRKRLSTHPLDSVDGIELYETDVHNTESLQRLFNGCSAVINLVGILNEKGSDGRGFRRAHVDLTGRIIHACKTSGVTRLLHMSALHASAEHGPSHYLYTKGEAQNMVAEANQHGLSTSWFCPSVIYGPGDSFFNRFAGLLKLAPVFPLACPHARFAPVYVGDVVKAFITSLENDNTIGQGYNLCGPEIYTLKELVEYTARTCAMKRLVIGLNTPLSAMQARMLGLLPGKPMSYDNYLSLTVDSACDEPYPAVFGRPQKLETIVPTYLCHH